MDGGRLLSSLDKCRPKNWGLYDPGGIPPLASNGFLPEERVLTVMPAERWLPRLVAGGQSQTIIELVVSCDPDLTSWLFISPGAAVWYPEG